MHFITRAMHTHYIDSKDHIRIEIEKQQKLYNQSYKVQIMPLVIYGHRGRHTYIRMCNTHAHIDICMKVISEN